MRMAALNYMTYRFPGKKLQAHGAMAYISWFSLLGNFKVPIVGLGADKKNNPFHYTLALWLQRIVTQSS